MKDVQDTSIADQLATADAVSSTFITYSANCVKRGLFYIIEFGKDIATGDTLCRVSMEEYTGYYEEVDGKPEYDYQEPDIDRWYSIPDGAFDFDTRKVEVTNQDTEENELVELVSTDDLVEYVESVI